MVAQFGERNPFWRGGRSIASNGYVLVRMPGHRLADVRGYVYEHRLVAEQTLGRELVDGEQVHHRNGIKADNRPENLEVCFQDEHFVHHRKRERGLRRPGQGNPTIVCGCGCGTLFTQFDAQNRPRRFVPGHNPPHAAPTRDGVLLALRGGPQHRSAIQALVGCSKHAVAVKLSRLRALGLVEPLGCGRWRLTESEVHRAYPA